MKMKIKTNLFLVLGALSLCACTNANRLDGGEEAEYTPPPAQTTPAIVPGSADDPHSTAYFRQRIGDRVLFEVDQSTLSPAARSTLDAQAGWLMRNPEYTAVIEGHADEQGTRAYNIALGNRRADAARSYLLSKGVSASRLQIVSYGKERPIEICSEEACYAKNRRAVTVLAAGRIG